MGSKLWFELTERHKIESSLEKLKKELGRRGKSGEDVVEPPIKGEHLVLKNKRLRFIVRAIVIVLFDIAKQ